MTCCPLLSSIFNFLFDAPREANGAGGADEAAEVATDAARAHDARLARGGVDGDGLVAAVVAGGVAAAATDAHVAVNLRIDDGRAVEVGGQIELWQAFAHKVLHLCDASLGHVMLQSKNHVVDDAVAILHNGCAYLYVTAPQLNELQRVAPRFDASCMLSPLVFMVVGV